MKTFKIEDLIKLADEIVQTDGEALGIPNTKEFVEEWVSKNYKEQSKGAVDWINEWVDLFPKGVKSGGKPIHSHPKDCYAKMYKFVKEYKYTKEQIFQATENYLEFKKRNNWEYTKCAVYFINKKDEPSLLAEWCEKLNEKQEVIVPQKNNSLI